MELKRALFNLSVIVLLAVGCKGKPISRTVQTSQDGPAKHSTQDSTTQAVTALPINPVGAEAPARTMQSLLIAPGVVGPLENGMNVDNALAIIGPGKYKLVDLQSEGTFNPALEVRLESEQKEPSLRASIRWPCSRFSIYGISVHDPRYRTREGLGVGSTLGELRRYFKLDGPFEEAEDGTLAAITPGITFALEHAEEPSDKTRVKAVWVYPDDEEIQKRWCP